MVLTNGQWRWGRLSGIKADDGRGPQEPAGGLLYQGVMLMVAMAVAEMLRSPLMSSPSLLLSGCSFGQVCLCRDGQQNRSRSFYGRRKKRRDRIVWKLCETRWIVTCPEATSLLWFCLLSWTASTLASSWLGKYCHLVSASRNSVSMAVFPVHPKVRVVAEGDPGRMMAHTEAWKSRHRQEECEDQRPLYPLNTYTDAQVRV